MKENRAIGAAAGASAPLPERMRTTLPLRGPWHSNVAQPHPTLEIRWPLWIPHPITEEAIAFLASIDHNVPVDRIEAMTYRVDMPEALIAYGTSGPAERPSAYHTLCENHGSIVETRITRVPHVLRADTWQKEATSYLEERRSPVFRSERVPFNPARFDEVVRDAYASNIAGMESVIVGTQQPRALLHMAKLAAHRRDHLTIDCLAEMAQLERSYHST